MKRTGSGLVKIRIKGWVVSLTVFVVIAETLLSLQLPSVGTAVLAGVSVAAALIPLLAHARDNDSPAKPSAGPSEGE